MKTRRRARIKVDYQPAGTDINVRGMDGIVTARSACRRLYEVTMLNGQRVCFARSEIDLLPRRAA
jgi:hypothetical protein